MIQNKNGEMTFLSPVKTVSLCLPIKKILLCHQQGWGEATFQSSPSEYIK